RPEYVTRTARLLAWCRRALSRYAFDPHYALVARDLPTKFPPGRNPDCNPHRRRVLAAAKPGPTRAQGQSYLPTHYWIQPQFAPTLVDEANWSSRIIEDLEVVFHGRRLAALHRGVRVRALFGFGWTGRVWNALLRPWLIHATGDLINRTLTVPACSPA